MRINKDERRLIPDITIYFEKIRNFLKPWEYTEFFLAQPSIKCMLFDTKRYYED